MGREEDGVGLCARCRHARRVPTPRSVFWLCELAASDTRFERYPRLPVLECPGFEPGARPADEADVAGDPGGE